MIGHIQHFKRKKKKEESSNLNNQIDNSKYWIEQYCIEIGCRVEELMDAAKDYIQYGEYWVQGSRWDGVSLDTTFWTHYEIVTGAKVEDKENFFSCSC